MNNIKKLRESHKQTAAELGAAIGRSQPTICKWENNRKLKYEDAIKNEKYVLVNRSTNLNNKDIAIELMIGQDSIGFLTYDKVTDTFKVYVTETNQEIIGYDDDVDMLLSSVMRSNVQISQTNSQVSLVLHKSQEVNAETNNMQVTVSVDLCEYNTTTNITTTTKLFLQQQMKQKKKKKQKKKTNSKRNKSKHIQYLWLSLRDTRVEWTVESCEEISI